jgi:hypothetical protein
MVAGHDGPVIFHHDLGREMRGVDLYNLLCMKLFYQVVCHKLSNVAYPRKPFHQNGIFKGHFLYLSNKSLFHLASRLKALRYFP